LIFLVPFLNGKRKSSEKPLLYENLPVWISEETKNTKNPLIKLHNEILDYAQYITLNKFEIQIRERAISMYFGYILIFRVTKHARECWPDCEAKIFGSYATGLSLNNSDIDLVF